MSVDANQLSLQEQEASGVGSELRVIFSTSFDFMLVVSSFFVDVVSGGPDPFAVVLLAKFGVGYDAIMLS